MYGILACGKVLAISFAARSSDFDTCPGDLQKSSGSQPQHHFSHTQVLSPPSLNTTRQSRTERATCKPTSLQAAQSTNMPTLHQYDYIFVIGLLFAALDAYNIGANDVAK